jgi:hypothetical protein
MTDNKPSPEWPADFFEKTAGGLADDPIERAPQGDYEIREVPPKNIKTEGLTKGHLCQKLPFFSRLLGS